MESKSKFSLLSEKYIFIFYIIIIVLINLVSLTLYFRLDLTRNSAYSLSDISEEVVSELADPLNIKVFFTEDLPAPYNAVHRYLKDLLEEYSEYGNENFNYEFIDVEKNKELSGDFGISSVQIREIKNDQLKFRNAFMGLAIVHGDLIEKIESITKSEGLEYKITSIIKKMTGKIDSLQRLEKPIEVTLYASSNLPLGGMEKLNERVSEIANRCKVRNYDKITYRFVDPYTDKSLGNVDEIYGIIKLNWTSSVNVGGKRIKPGEGIIGIVVELGDKFESIQILSRTLFGGYAVGGLENLEDKINSAIDNIININPKIGYITGHGERSLTDQNGAPNLKQLLSDMYEVEEIELAKNDISDEISTIIINGPKQKLSDYELLKIDQFVMKGKSVFFLLDSFNEVSPQGGNMFGGGRPMVLPLNTGLENVVSHYGVTVNKDIVLDKKCYKTTQPGFGGQDIYFVPIVGDAGLNNDNLVTRYIKTVVFPKVSSLKIVDDKQDIKGTVLVSSSDESWLMQGRISFMPFGMSPPEESKMSSYNLAVLLSGKFTSYFKGKEIPVDENEEQKGKGKKAKIATAGIIESGVKPGNIIVIGSSEITSAGVLDKDGRSLNSILLHNMVDYISANYDVPEMRSKGLAFNPLEDTEEGTRLMLKLLNIAGLPILVIGAGLLVWRRRRTRKGKIMDEFIGS